MPTPPEPATPLLSLIVLIALLSGTALPTYAGSTHDHLQHDAHVHGEARLTLVLEDNALEIAFHSPAHNLVGFEHTPRTDDERQRTMAIIAALKNSDTLFSLDGGDCTLQNAAVNQQTPAAKHDKHDHPHNRDAEPHREFEAQYRYQCRAGNALQRIQVDLMTVFPGIEKITAEWIFDARQGRAVLTRNATTIGVK